MSVGTYFALQSALPQMEKGAWFAISRFTNEGLNYNN
jgi:hypothetical protein